jgi:hypothetical protein
LCRRGLRQKSLRIRHQRRKAALARRGRTQGLLQDGKQHRLALVNRESPRGGLRLRERLRSLRLRSLAGLNLEGRGRGRNGPDHGHRAQYQRIDETTLRLQA